MKDTKSNQKQEKRSAENWVDIARNFGEKCVEIQHDPKLTLDQKLEKQKTLSEKMFKEIQNDPYLNEEDKKLMLNSIKDYMNDWTKIHDSLKANSSDQQEKNHQK